MIDASKLSKADLIAMLETSQEEVSHLKNVLDHLPGSVYWKDKNGVYLGHNEFASNTVKIMGYDWHSMVGRTDHDVFPKAMADQFRQNDILTMDSENEITTEERSVTKDGEVIVQLSTKKPFYDRSGQVAGIIANTINITRLKEIAAELKQAKETAEKADKFKSQIIQNLEHDIRTPFAGILALSNLLLAREVDADKKDKLRSIAECAQELLDYCNEMLEVVNLESSQLKHSPLLFNVRQLVENLIKAERPAAMIRGLKVLFECDSEVPYYLLGDRVRLYRVLLNLLSNAVKFTPKGQVTIRLRLQDIQADNLAILVFEVQDTGIGIAKDKQDYIFEKFARLTPANHGKYKGTGLGLSFVKKYVTDMQGSIEVKSEVGKGALFVCKLPFFIARKSKVEDHNSREPARNLSPTTPRVLMVEDHVISRKVSAQVLKDEGCIVDAVQDGHEAIAHFQANVYDLALVDIGLPDIDGFSVIEAMRQIHSAHTTALAILTAHSSGDYRERAAKLGIEHFVVKPLTAKNARTVLQQCLGARFSNMQSKQADAQQITLNGIQFCYNRNQDIKRFHEIFHAGFYHLKLEAKAPVIVDASANIGLSALYYKLLYPDSTIICFESDTARFNLLKANTETYQLDNITLVNEPFTELPSDAFIHAPARTHIPQADTHAALNLTDMCFYKACRNKPIDLLKIETSSTQDDFINTIKDKLEHVKNLVITFHVLQPQAHCVDVYTVRKALLPYFKNIHIVESPQVIQTRQHFAANLTVPEQQCYLIYARDPIRQQAF